MQLNELSEQRYHVHLIKEKLHQLVTILFTTVSGSSDSEVEVGAWGGKWQWGHKVGSGYMGVPQ